MTKRKVAMDEPQWVVPMLDYADGPAAMDWLAEAFGFVERTRMVGDGGRVPGAAVPGRGH
ncbi:MAG: hypothetical protein AUI14_18920 [Actinobacteria bacterium 13_2_20CM_2_71_6]|nr:MAG: hypothetical protein AUI14_18920 [Actinobacteria bacterium 13_2_20CM_2_71_6]